MAKKKHGVILELATTKPGPSVLALLVISTGLAVLILGCIWLVLFRV